VALDPVGAGAGDADRGRPLAARADGVVEMRRAEREAGATPVEVQPNAWAETDALAEAQVPHRQPTLPALPPARHSDEATAVAVKHRYHPYPGHYHVQMRIRARYGEGDWFAVPLRDGGFATGVIARANPHGVLFGYFFGPKRRELPTTRDLTGLSATTAILVARFGHLGLKDGKWPLIESARDWNRADWPIPTFGRFEDLSGRAFAVEYDPDDPNSRPRKRRSLSKTSRGTRATVSPVQALSRSASRTCWRRSSLVMPAV